MANYSKAFGDPAKKLAVQIAIEQITGKYIESGYSNADMERGHQQEPIARALYEDQYFVDVANGGFFDCGNAGCSPDGLVNDDGLIEIKSVQSHIHYANIKRNSIDPAYKWQLYFNLLHTDRQWIDFVSYCEDFPKDKKLFVYRVRREDCQQEFEMIETRKAEFFSLVDEVKQTIRGVK